MLDSIKKRCEEASTGQIIGAAFLAIFGVLLLITGGAVFLHAYMVFYTGMGGGFIAICVAITLATLITLFMGLIVIAFLAHAFNAFEDIFD